jgi:hypothetical protein
MHSALPETIWKCEQTVYILFYIIMLLADISESNQGLVARHFKFPASSNRYVAPGTIVISIMNLSFPIAP